MNPAAALRKCQQALQKLKDTQLNMLVSGIAAAFIVLTPIADARSGNKVEVPFLFTDDQVAPHSDLSQIKQSDALRNDSYLNAPMTRLEYFLTQMEATLNDGNKLAVVREYLADRFEKAKPLRQQRIRGHARYIEERGPPS